MKKNLLFLLAITMMIATTIQAQIPTNGLVAWYPFTGNANDSSGNGYNGVVNGATLTTDRFGKANSAYSLDGSSNYISLQSNYIQDFSTKFTISVWINESYLNPNYNQTIVSTNAFRFQTGSGLKSLPLCAGWSPTGTPQPATNSTILLNTWTNVVLIKNDTSVSFYINGSKYDSLYSSSNFKSEIINNLRIGADGLTHIGLTDYFNGKLDDIAVYNRVLDSSEIQSLYHQGGYDALPIKLVNVAADISGSDVVLKWQTSTELNTNHFVIQRSNDGINFTDLSSVKAMGSGSNNYQFIDLSPVKGNNYYRLQSVDKDGSFSYSKVVSVNMPSKEGFTLVPNPAVSNTTLRFSGLINSASISVYNTAGQKVYTDKFSGSSSSSYILPTSKLSAGTYIVNVITKEGKYSDRLVITK